ncbi:MAG: DciA family protein [Phycisphaerae bacterium]
MIPDNHNPKNRRMYPTAAGKGDTAHHLQKTYRTVGQSGTARLTLEDLRHSRERQLLHKLQRKIAMTPPVDHHPPQRLGDFLPQWFDKNVTKSGNLLIATTETLQAIVPPELLRAIALGPLQRGQLTLYCSSSTAKMELDMLVRAGTPGLRQIQIATKGLIFKVKTVVNRTYIKS